MPLATPNDRITRQSMAARSRQARNIVATACGIATTATASGTPMRVAISGVSRLPIPNPAMEAVAPLITATANSAARNSGVTRRSSGRQLPHVHAAHDALGVPLEHAGAVDEVDVLHVLDHGLRQIGRAHV